MSPESVLPTGPRRIARRTVSRRTPAGRIPSPARADRRAGHHGSSGAGSRGGRRSQDAGTAAARPHARAGRHASPVRRRGGRRCTGLDVLGDRPGGPRGIGPAPLHAGRPLPAIREV